MKKKQKYLKKANCCEEESENGNPGLHNAVFEKLCLKLFFQFCVKIIDRMNPGSDYVTYTSDCYYMTTIQVNPYNLSYVHVGACFPFQDGSYPVKR